MKNLLIVTILALVFVPAALAQNGRQNDGHLTYGIGSPYQPKVDHSLEQLIDARAKLIGRYVKGTYNYAWGVSVCGNEDVWNGDGNSWLTVYLYSDSLTSFAMDFDKFATRTGNGTLTIDGITVVVEVIDRPHRHADLYEKGGTTNGQPDGKHSDRGSSVPTFRRAA